MSIGKNTKDILPIPRFDIVKPNDFVSVRKDPNGFPTLDRMIADNFKPNRPWPHLFTHSKIDWMKIEHKHWRELFATYNEYYERIRELSRHSDLKAREIHRELQNYIDNNARLESAEEFILRLKALKTRADEASKNFLLETLKDWKKNTILYDKLFMERFVENSIQHRLQWNLFIEQMQNNSYKSFKKTS